MTELVGLVGDATLPAFLTTLLLFGFAPGFVLRLMVKLYPKGDPRRLELVAELYVIKRIWRPIWVAEQIEVALFDGLDARWEVRRRGWRQRAYRLSTTGLVISAAGTGVAGHLAIRTYFLYSYLLKSTGRAGYWVSNIWADDVAGERGMSVLLLTDYEISRYWWSGTALAVIVLAVVVLRHRQLLRRAMQVPNE